MRIANEIRGDRERVRKKKVRIWVEKENPGRNRAKRFDGRCATASSALYLVGSWVTDANNHAIYLLIRCTFY